MIPDEISMEVSIPLDDDGYLDRECPAPACLAAFKIHADDWKEKVRDEVAGFRPGANGAQSNSLGRQPQVYNEHQQALKEPNSPR